MAQNEPIEPWIYQDNLRYLKQKLKEAENGKGSLYACEVVHARLCRIENEVDTQGRGWQITDKMRKQREQLEKKFLALTTKGDLK